MLEANIRLSGDRGHSSRVVLTACYRLPLGITGAGVDRLLWHKVATATFKRFLARLARVREGTREAAGETATSSWREPGPEPAPN